MIAVFLAILKLSLIALGGFCLYKKNVIKEVSLKFLTFSIITFTVPFLVFSHLIENSKIVLTHSVWIFVLISIGVFLAGYILGFIASFGRRQESRREFISMVSFQNGGYLPMNIALFLFSGQMKNEFLVYIFLYLLGYNIIMWSLGSFFIFRKKEEKFVPKALLTPIVISTVFALVLVYTNMYRFVPGLLLVPMRAVGSLSFVLSAVVLGCWLAKVNLENIRMRLFFVAKATFLKLIILPLLFLIALINFKIFSLLGVFIILQAAMPTAVSLPIIANLKGADSEFISQGVFLTHALSIFTIPLWLGLYLKLSNFSL